HPLVGDDREAPAQERKNRLAPNELGVALVLWMHGHRHVTEQGLRPRGRDADPALGVGRAVVAGQVIADRPEAAHLLAVDVLEVAEGGLAAWAPVDERLPAIGESGIP